MATWTTRPAVDSGLRVSVLPTVRDRYAAVDDALCSCGATLGRLQQGGSMSEPLQRTHVVEESGLRVVLHAHPAINLALVHNGVPSSPRRGREHVRLRSDRRHRYRSPARRRRRIGAGLVTDIRRTTRTRARAGVADSLVGRAGNRPTAGAQRELPRDDHRHRVEPVA